MPFTVKTLAFLTIVVCALGAAPALRAQTAPAAPTPGMNITTPDAAKAYWAGNTSMCRLCHGANGEGGFGPNLAGRGLSAAEFTRALRQPWGVMPAYTETQLTDQDLSTLAAYFAAMPKPAQIGTWNTPVPANAPERQTVMITAGCGQCHGPVLGMPRIDGGAEGADYAWFAKYVYEHTSEVPKGRMGNFNKLRLPESTLREIWQYASVDLGLRAKIAGQVTAAAPAGGNTTYTITLTNGGVVGKGLAAENVTVAITLPAGAKVVSTSTNAYQGVTHDATANTDAAVWTAPRIAAGEKIAYTLTLSGATTAPKGQARWTKPTVDTANIN